MSRTPHREGLDDELARAAGIGEGGDPASGGMAVPEPPDAPTADGSVAGATRQRSLGLLATLLVMVAGLVALFFYGFNDAAIYSKPVDRLLADANSVGQRVRIEGELVPGTLVRRDQPCEYRFRIRGDGKELEIRYPQCVIPDTFRDVPQGGVAVTADGKLTPEGHFEASEILAKCSSKYDPKTHTMGAPSATVSPDAL